MMNKAAISLLLVAAIAVCLADDPIIAQETQAIGGYFGTTSLLALNWNVGDVRQNDPKHPSPFMSNLSTPAVSNQQWQFTLYNGATGQYCTISNGNGSCLDANVAANSDRFPFLWPCVPSALNHQWVVTGTSQGWTIQSRYNKLYLVYDPSLSPQYTSHRPSLASSAAYWTDIWNDTIVNRTTLTLGGKWGPSSSLMVLDGNVGAVNQHDPQHPSPFVGNPQSTLSQQWTFSQCTSITGNYWTITNFNGSCLDANVAANSEGFAFLWPCASKAWNHQWFVTPTPQGWTMQSRFNSMYLAFDYTLSPQYYWHRPSLAPALNATSTYWLQV